MATKQEKMEEAAGETAVAPEQEYGKQQLIASRRYIHRRDLVSALLNEDEAHTISEVDKWIKNYDERRM